MKQSEAKFENIVDMVYGLSLEYREELKNLLENNISEARRNEILKNFKKSRAEQKAGKLKFASSLDDLKKML